MMAFMVSLEVAGQNGYGIFILNCLNITITYNTLRSINGGSGGTSGDTVNGAISGNGVGIYLEILKMPH